MYDGGDLQILRQRIELRAQRGRGRLMNRLNALRGLHGERGDRLHAVAGCSRGKSLEVGSHTEKRRTDGSKPTGDWAERWGENEF